MKTAKNFIFSILLSAISISVSGQAVFNNAAGGSLWSTVGNWYLNTPPTATTHATINFPVTLDVDATLYHVRSINSTVNNGAGKITAVGTTTSGPALRQVSGGVSGNVFLFDAAMEINTTVATNNSYLEVQTVGAKLILGSNSKLTLTTMAEVIAVKTDNKEVQFNGKLDGNGLLRFGGNSKSIFGSTSNNADYNGDMIFFANHDVISNTADEGVFLKAGRKVQVNLTGGSLTLNGANNMKGNISLANNNVFSVNINKNQNNIGVITLGTTSTLNIIINDAVTELFFANCAANDWATGAVIITGFKEGVIRFGTDATGLTTAQLSKINVGGQAVKLDANGYLVYDGTTAITPQKMLNESKISFPTKTTGVINFNKQVNGLRVVSLNGQLINQYDEILNSVDLSYLKSGMYFMVYNNGITEKFIKY